MQVEAARRRLAMVPPELRVKRGKAIEAKAPAGTSWCAGCQSFRDLADFAKGATRCRPCASSATHDAMVAKVYGITGDDYATLLAAQGGRCAICRARPKSKRLAVDHDHASGAVRGLLCARCNHDLLGSAWDSLALATALWHYLNTPPAGGGWLPPEQAPPLRAEKTRSEPSGAPRGETAPLVTNAATASRGAAKRGVSVEAVECTRPHVLPVGAVSVPGRRGAWRIWVGEDSPPPF